MMPFDLRRLQRETHYSNQYVESRRFRLNDFDKDESKYIRVSANECKTCFYLRRGDHLAGQAFTEWTCTGCSSEYMYHNTSVPKLCPACSTKFSACVRCCGDLDGKKRMKLEKR